MFSAFQTFGKLGALASSVARAWSPLALWPDGIATPGMWISPRTLTSEWQDYTGTTPVGVPGTVADSSNPVGLALDLRAGDPVLGPELVTNGDFDTTVADWNTNSCTLTWVAGDALATSSGGGFWQEFATVAGVAYKAVVPIISGTTQLIAFQGGGLSVTLASEDGAAGARTATITFFATTSASRIYIKCNTNAVIDSVSVREIPGNHMLQSTSAARPLLSAYDGQTLGPGDTYDGTGYPIYQKYDGTDDGMATAAFAAGTLIDGMDCMIPVRRDSAAETVIGLCAALNSRYFGAADALANPAVFYSGSPTVWVDGTQLSGGTSVLSSTLGTALTVGTWHIVEFRGLDLSLWTQAIYSGFVGAYSVNGPRGDILLYPSTASTEDKDAARQWLADYYGVTLP